MIVPGRILLFCHVKLYVKSHRLSILSFKVNNIFQSLYQFLWIKNPGQNCCYFDGSFKGSINFCAPYDAACIWRLPENDLTGLRYFTKGHVFTCLLYTSDAADE